MSVSPGRSLWSYIRGCLLAAVIVVGLFGAWIAISLMTNPIGGNPNTPETPSVRWSTQTVRLDAERPRAAGRLEIVLGAAVTGRTGGISVGVPRTIGGDSAGGVPALRDPNVRLAISAAGTPLGSCTAPCELPLSWPSCDGAACSLVFDVIVELGPDGPTREPRAVDVEVSGGLTAPLGKRLPDEASAELVLEAVR